MLSNIILWDSNVLFTNEQVMIDYDERKLNRTLVDENCWLQHEHGILFQFMWILSFIGNLNSSENSMPFRGSTAFPFLSCK